MRRRLWAVLCRGGARGGHCAPPVEPKPPNAGAGEAAAPNPPNAGVLAGVAAREGRGRAASRFSSLLETSSRRPVAGAGRPRRPHFERAGHTTQAELANSTVRNITRRVTRVHHDSCVARQFRVAVQHTQQSSFPLPFVLPLFFTERKLRRVRDVSSTVHAPGAPPKANPPPCGAETDVPLLSENPPFAKATLKMLVEPR